MNQEGTGEMGMNKEGVAELEVEVNLRGGL